MGCWGTGRWKGDRVHFTQGFTGPPEGLFFSIVENPRKAGSRKINTNDLIDIKKKKKRALWLSRGKGTVAESGGNLETLVIQMHAEGGLEHTVHESWL